MRTLLSLVAFFTAFGVACAIIWVPPILEEVPGTGPKYTYYRQNQEAFDTIFIGSSRVFHHFLPEQFDPTVTRDTGRPVRSFNFGYDAMWPPESFYMLRQVLKLRPPNLRWVLIDLMQIDPEIDDQNNTTLRIVYWHDLKHTLMALRALQHEPQISSWRKLSIGGAHIRHMLHRWVHLGRGSDLLESGLRGPAKDKVSSPKWVARSGFEVGKDQPMVGAELARFEKLLLTLRKRTRIPELRPEFRHAVQEIVNEVRAYGAEPVFVLAPTLNWRERVAALPGDAPVLSFAEPDKYPALYDPANHYDAWHLNERGAVIFSELLAEEFSKIVNGTPSLPGGKNE